MAADIAKEIYQGVSAPALQLMLHSGEVNIIQSVCQLFQKLLAAGGEQVLSWDPNGRNAALRTLLQVRYPPPEPLYPLHIHRNITVSGVWMRLVLLPSLPGHMYPVCISFSPHGMMPFKLYHANASPDSVFPPRSLVNQCSRVENETQCQHCNVRRVQSYT